MDGLWKGCSEQLWAILEPFWAALGPRWWMCKGYLGPTLVDVLWKGLLVGYSRTTFVNVAVGYSGTTLVDVPWKG